MKKVKGRNGTLNIGNNIKIINANCFFCCPKAFSMKRAKKVHVKKSLLPADCKRKAKSREIKEMFQLLALVE